MRTISYTTFRRQLAECMREVANGGVPFRVTRHNARAVIVLSADEFDGMVETLHLLRIPANADRLLRSVASADVGQMAEHSLAEEP